MVGIFLEHIPNAEIMVKSLSIPVSYTKTKLIYSKLNPTYAHSHSLSTRHKEKPGGNEAGVAIYNHLYQQLVKQHVFLKLYKHM